MKSSTCFKDAIGFDDRWAMVVGVPVASVIVAIVFFGDDFTACHWGSIRLCLPISLVYTTFYWLAMRKIYYEVWMRYPELSDSPKRIGWSAFGFLVSFFVINCTLNVVLPLIFKGHDKSLNPLVHFVVTMILCSLVIAIYEASAYYTKLNTTIKEKAELERHYISSQLEGLRNQVNPHFLFNSLNTLIYLIPEDTTKAVNFVQKMSKVYRYILESRDAKVIPLEEELEFLHAYIFLLKERFGDNLQVKINIGAPASQQFIVPLSLQMLFENAIKHNIISTEKPLVLEVFSENKRLVVRNNLQRKNQVMDSTGVGLQNIRDRYKMMSEEPVDVIVSPQYFTVVLPLIQVEGEAQTFKLK